MKHLIDTPTAATVPAPLPSKLELVLRDGQKITVHNPIVRGDSLLADRDPTNKERVDNPNAPWRRTPYAVALSEVREMKSRQDNGLETVLLVTGVAGVIVLTIVFLSELSQLD